MDGSSTVSMGSCGLTTVSATSPTMTGVEGTFDRAKVINQHVRTDDAKVPGESESGGPTEPVPGDDGEGVEPV